MSSANTNAFPNDVGGGNANAEVTAAIARALGNNNKPRDVAAYLRALADSLSPKHQAVSLPALQACSHWASVSSPYFWSVCLLSHLQ